MAQKYLQHILLALITFTLGMALVGAFYWKKTADLPVDAPPLSLATQAPLASTEAIDSEPNPLVKKDPDPCGKAFSTFEMMNCYGDELKKENAETVSLNHELVAAWAGQEDGRLRVAFKAAHKAWLEYREKDCHAAAEEWAGGTGQWPVHLSCLWSMTKERNDGLRTQLSKYR